MTKPELLDQKGIITEDVCGLFRTRERRDRVSLGVVVVRLWIISGQGVVCTHAVSDDENWVLELLRVVWGKLLNGTGGLSMRGITEEAIVRIIPQEMNASSCTYPLGQMVPT